MMSAWAHSLIIQKLSMVVFMSWVISKIYSEWHKLDGENINYEPEKTGEYWRRVPWPDLFKYYDIDLRGQYLSFFPTIKIVLTKDRTVGENITSDGIDEDLFEITPLKIVALVAVGAIFCTCLYKVKYFLRFFWANLKKNKIKKNIEKYFFFVKIPRNSEISNIFFCIFKIFFYIFLEKLEYSKKILKISKKKTTTKSWKVKKNFS